MVSMAAIASVLAALASLLFGSLKLTLGVVAGGALMTGDIFLLRRVVTGLIGDETPDLKEASRKRRFLVFQYIIKVIGLFVVLALLIWKTNVHPVGLLAGVTAAILGLIYVGLRDADIEK